MGTTAKARVVRQPNPNRRIERTRCACACLVQRAETEPAVGSPAALGDCPPSSRVDANKILNQDVGQSSLRHLPAPAQYRQTPFNQSSQCRHQALVATPTARGAACPTAASSRRPADCARRTAEAPAVATRAARSWLRAAASASHMAAAADAPSTAAPSWPSPRGSASRTAEAAAATLPSATSSRRSGATASLTPSCCRRATKLRGLRPPPSRPSRAPPAPACRPPSPSSPLTSS